MERNNSEQVATNGENSSDPYGYLDALSPTSQRPIEKSNEKSDGGADKSIELTGKTVRQYMTNKEAINYEAIKNTNNAFLADIYRTLMSEHPELGSVLVVDDNIEGNAHYSNLNRRNDGSVVQEMHFNFSNTETYLKPENLRKGDNYGLDCTLKTIALKTGALSSDVERNKRLVSAFIMLHEFGHAVDFLNNYFRVEFNKEYGKNPNYYSGPSGLDPSKKYDLMALTLPRAIERSSEDRLKNTMTMPIPGNIKMDNNRALVALFSGRLKALGIDPEDYSDIYFRDKKAYREMSDEAFADNFATDFILRHYDYFFVGSDSQNPSSSDSSERIKTYIGEWRRPSSGSDLDMLGLAEGRFVKLTKYGRTGGSSEVIEGFLSNKIAIGKDVTLLSDGNPQSSGGRKVMPDVRNVIFKATKKNGEIANEVWIDFKGGAEQGEPNYYLVELSDMEPEEVEVSAEDAMKELGLGVGSKVMLMKRDLNTNSRRKLGSIVSGKLKPANGYSGDPIAKGYPIFLSPADGKDIVEKDLIKQGFLRGGQLSNIRKIYRKWKRYYVVTQTSTYEISPLQ